MRIVEHAPRQDGDIRSDGLKPRGVLPRNVADLGTRKGVIVDRILDMIQCRNGSQGPNKISALTGIVVPPPRHGATHNQDFDRVRSGTIAGTDIKRHFTEQAILWS